ncbi:hypothetical protein KIN20_037210 [Parelaphostrongylus tenuis]|uniref:Uncharacterized protein n=1 Tax=Parelaphostrongylus tenuis TaxID=148309 RepID=A0AAD5WL02_PARTN|nr:hypothetical protein KIN20_037210 [Parelaphostrongylus tenuis]
MTSKESHSHTMSVYIIVDDPMNQRRNQTMPTSILLIPQRHSVIKSQDYSRDVQQFQTIRHQSLIMVLWPILEDVTISSHDHYKKQLLCIIVADQIFHRKKAVIVVERVEGVAVPKDMYYEYPTTASYEGPLDSTQRVDDIHGEPLTHHVTVYHSGRSDEPTSKPDETHLDLADAAKTLGDKITGLFKKGEAHLDYPVSELYEGPLDSTQRVHDIEGEPLTHHVSVYHSGRSDEPAPKPDDAHLDLADTAKTFGDKITGLFKRRPTISDYPSSEPYYGPLADTRRRDDIESRPLQETVTVYHSGRSDIPQEKAVIVVERVEGVAVPKDMYYEYPTTASYEGPLDSTQRVDDIHGEPLTHHVTVYHSGRSDEPTSKPDETHLDLADAAKTLGDKITGLFKKGEAHLDYPVSELYEGPLDSTQRVHDIEGEPLTHHVSVYHSGRSDEPAPKPDDAHLDLADTAKTFGDKITGLFKRRPTISDYPSSEPYYGPLADTRRRDDIESRPLQETVTVYHSGRSDIPQEKAVIVVERVEGVAVPKDMYYEYPTTASYEGPLDSTQRVDDIHGEPLTHHVTVYHSGRSDEPTSKPDETHLDLADAAKTLGDKITGLFKKGEAHLDYPVSELYEGPLDSTQRVHDIEGEPLTHHVSVYHSGRSDEPAPKPDDAHLDLADTAKTFGDKITGLFKRRPTISDYPSSEPYYGPLADTRRRDDIESRPLQETVTVYHSGRSDIPQEKAVIVVERVEGVAVPKDMYYEYPTTASYEGPLDSTQRVDDIHGEPLTHHVTVYHSGRSDEPTSKPDETHLDLADAAKTLGDKITGLFKKGEAHLDYPVSELYEGPLDSTQRVHDIEGEPLTHHVSVYHSGRSDEPAPKPDDAHLDLADTAKTFGDKITGLFKRRPTISDYPSSEPYYGPLADTRRRDDIESRPLQETVTVYHSGRSDIPQEKAVIVVERVEGVAVPKDMYYEYPTTASYEGPLDSTQRVDDIHGEPLTHHVTVYHSGRSDEPTSKPDETHLDLADAAKTLGDKITGLFKKGEAHLDYPVSELYEGPLDSTQRVHDIEGEPLTHHVSVYHSGRSDEPAPKPDDAHLDLADTAKTFGDKITGLFKRRPTISDYPSSEPYYGPLADTRRRDDIESRPLQETVTVYHSGRSDIPQEKAVIVVERVEGVAVPKDMYYEYPTTASYEGPLDSTQRVDDIHGEPLTHHVTVYHSGRSDEPTSKPDETHLDLADAAKTLGDKITGLFKKGEAHLDYPVSELYEGPLDSTQRVHDIEGEPLTHHVSVYHSGRSDEPAPKPDDAHLDLADTAKTFGDKITGLFKRRPTISDYPSSEPYYGPLADTRRRDDIESRPLQETVTVYHSGRSDIPQEKAVIVVERVEGVAVPKDMYYEYPTTASYEGPLDSTQRVDDIHGEPLTHHVTVYHSGRSDEPTSKPDETHLDLADAAKTLGDKITGLFKKGEAHLDYPVSELYEGPLDSTQRVHDIEGEPLTHHVSVYHSGRSDEPAPKPDDAHLDLADTAKTFGDKITGLFKRRPTISDYPSSEPYYGPLADTRRRDDIESRPLQETVTVYHSGRSDIPQEKAVIVVERVEGVAVPKDMYYEYPTTASYEGPLDSTQRVDDIHGEPLTHHVTVYHSGRSDEPTSKPDETHLDLADAAKTLGDKITGLFKKGEAHLDYPVSELYEGPLDSTQRVHDIEGEPLTHHVSVYHSGRSDEPAPKPDDAHLDLADTAKTFGDKITGLFKRRPTISDYPSSEPYYGPLADTRRRDDIESRPLQETVTVYHSGRSDIPQEKAVIVVERVEGVAVPKDMYYEYPTTASYEGPLDSTQRVDDIHGEPLTHHVTVYHSGRSDEPTSKPDETHLDLADAAKTLGDKITGLFKKGEAHLDYPVSELYEGPLDSTQRVHDIEGEPLTHHVSVYHSGRSDEPAPKPDDAHLDLADTAKTFGDKITGLFKRRPTISDYPSSEPYYGPLADTRRRDDIESRPLQETVTVYHSGRSDIPQEKAVIVVERVEGVAVPKDMYYEYPTTASYEGPLDSTQRVDDIHGEPLTHHVTVYHSGRSDEPTSKPDETHLDLADAAKTLGDKITGLFKKGEAHLDYPVSELYEGPLDSTQRVHDIEGEPLTHHVSVYHSGRSDEPAPKPDDAHLDLADTAKTFGDKITGLFKRRPTISDYPSSEPYYGPLADTRRRDDIESRPLQETVTVYHSGRSDIPQEKSGNCSRTGGRSSCSERYVLRISNNSII